MPFSDLIAAECGNSTATRGASQAEFYTLFDKDLVGKAGDVGLKGDAPTGLCVPLVTCVESMLDIECVFSPLPKLNYDFSTLAFVSLKP